MSGKALVLVCSHASQPAGTDSTVLHLSVHGSGEYTEEMSKVVEDDWHHFLFERFNPYVESGAYLPKGVGV